MRWTLPWNLGFHYLRLLRLPLVGPTPPLNVHLYSMWWMNYTMKWFYEIHLIYNWIMRYTGWGTVTESTTVGGQFRFPSPHPVSSLSQILNQHNLRYMTLFTSNFQTVLATFLCRSLEVIFGFYFYYIGVVG